MKKCIGLFLAFLFLVQFALGSPLVFKTTKEIKGDGWTELAIFDSSKYKQIRVGVVDDNVSESVLNISAAEETQEIFIQGATDNFLNVSFLIDQPPTKLKISAKGAGVYKVYIWAQ
jgi:hypothetical protein